MKFILVSMILISSVFAQDKLNRFVQAYKAKDMSLACEIGRQLYRSNLRDEKILIAIGHACAEDDYIDFIGVLQQRLGSSPTSRHATVYFSTLLLKKRLISEYMHEDTDLSPYTLPLTDHILSKVFDAIQSGHFKLIAEAPKHLRIGDKENYIDVYVKDKLYINIVKDAKIVQKHQYR